MAGRDLPGQQGADSRWLVDRQIYERRRDGVRYVTWSRGRQLRFAWLVVLLLVMAAGAGGLSVWAWLHLAPRLTAALPADVRSVVTDSAGGVQPADPRLRELEAARDAALRERDAVRTQLERIVSRSEPAEPSDVVDRTAAAVGSVAPAGASLGTDLELETTLLRHERDAARQQIDALMQLTAQLKAELSGQQSPLAGSSIDAYEGDRAAASMAVELASLRQARDEAVQERDRLQNGLRDAEAAARALQTNYDRLAGRVSDAEQALAARDRQMMESRRAVDAAEAALADAKRVALADATAAQAAQRALREQLDDRDAASRTLEAGRAAAEAERTTLSAELARVTADRDQAIAAERASREERDALASRLKSLDDGRQPAEAGLATAEREQLVARAAELQAALDAAKAAADESGRRLVQAQGELAGAHQSAEGLRQALGAARAELAQKEELLAAVPALQARLALAEAKAAETMQAQSAADATVLPMATWTVVEDGTVDADEGPLREELATALLRIKELAGRVSESENRAAELERYLGSMAPSPPPVAPRQSDGG